MTADSPRCEFVIRVVADGTADDMLRLSLCLLPRAGADIATGAIALDQWPAAIAALFQGEVGLVLRARDSTNVVPIVAKVTANGSPQGAALWLKLFTAAGGPSWSNLWSAMRVDQDVEALSPQTEYDASHVLSYRIDAPARLLEKSFAAPAVNALMMLRQDSSGRSVDTLLPSKTLVPLIHANFLNMFKDTTRTDSALDDGAAVVSPADAPVSDAVLARLGRRRADRDETGGDRAAPDAGLPVDSGWQAIIATAFNNWRSDQRAFVAASMSASPTTTAPPAGSSPDVHAERVRLLGELDQLLDRLFAQAASPEEMASAAALLTDSATLAPAGDVFRDAFALYHLATRRDFDDSHDKNADEENTPPAIARRKLAAILTQPALARAMGFTIDLEFNRSALPASPSPSYFELAVAPGLAGSERTLWSATKLDGAFFGPVPMCEYLRRIDPITGAIPRPTNGLVDLGQSGLGTGPRYGLSQIDVPLGLESWENTGRSRQNQALQGDGEEVSPRTPTLLGGLLQLSDAYAGHSVLADIISNDPARTVLFEEDLRAGYRMDVGIAKKGMRDVPADRWRSLTEAEVTFADLGPDPIRSDGWFEPVARLTDTEEGQPKQVVANPVISRWGGDSLALAARATAETEQQDGVPQQSDARQQISWLSTDTDLALQTKFAYPTKPHKVWGVPKRLPPARYGRSYTVGVRTALINGGGLTLAQAGLGYGQEMTPPGGPVRLQRFDEIQSPVVLVADKDRLANATSLDDLAGEQINSLILRSDARTDPGAVRRYLVPPRVPMESISRHGMLDAERTAVPRGAFEGYKLDPVSGEFISLPPLSGRHAIARTEPAGSRGAVLKPGTSKPKQPWYPDPLAERCCLMFRRNGRVPAGFGKGAKLDPASLIVKINPRAAWPAAMPLEIEVVAIPGEGPIRGRMDDVSTKEGGAKVRIRLAKGETIDLVAWMIPADPRALDEHAIFEFSHHLAVSIGATQRVESFGKMGQELEMLLRQWRAAPSLDSDAEFNARFGRAPIPGLSTSVTLTLTHASKKPVLAPRINMIPRGEALRPMVALIRPTPGAGDPARDWADWARGSTTEDLLDQPSGRHGERAFFVGSVAVERMSTRRIDVQMRWRDHGPDAVTKVADDQWAYSPIVAHWHSVGHIDLAHFDAGGSLDRVDLTYDAAKLPRGLHHDFGDTRARSVDVRIVALSRYVPFFEGQSPPEQIATEDYTLLSRPETLLVPSTARPPLPSLTSFDTLPMSRFAVKAVGNGFEVSRSSVLELRFADADVSGEGEIIGIVCPTRAQQDVDGLDSRTGFGRFLSRQGQDPMFEAGHVEPWFEPRHFTGARSAILKMPYIAVGGSGPQPPASADVQVYGLAPTFDTRRGDWYLHLPLDSGQSYAPFVRLGLARWQTNSIPGEELSLPVTSLQRVHPDRVTTATFLSEQRLAVVVRGQAYRRTWRPAGDVGEAWHGTTMELRLYYRDGAQWFSETDPETGLPSVATDRSHTSGAGAEWRFELQLPRAHSKRHYAVWLEEFGWIEGDGAQEGTSEPVKFEPHYQCKIDMRAGLTQ